MSESCLPWWDSNFGPCVSEAVDVTTKFIFFQFGSPNQEKERPPLLSSPEVQLRFLNPGDLCEVKRLCQEWFPIEYPDSW